jgi:activator of 2-hydroxyglutaryl-CoA dehydratase
VVRALGQAFGTTISVPPKPDTVGALGAALIARERDNQGY